MAPDGLRSPWTEREVKTWLGEPVSLLDPLPRRSPAGLVAADPLGGALPRSRERRLTEENALSAPAARWYGCAPDPDRERLLGLGGREFESVTAATRGDSPGELGGSAFGSMTSAGECARLPSVEPASDPGECWTNSRLWCRACIEMCAPRILLATLPASLASRSSMSESGVSGVSGVWKDVCRDCSVAETGFAASAASAAMRFSTCELWIDARKESGAASLVCLFAPRGFCSGDECTEEEFEDAFHPVAVSERRCDAGEATVGVETSECGSTEGGGEGEATLEDAATVEAVSAEPSWAGAGESSVVVVAEVAAAEAAAAVAGGIGEAAAGGGTFVTGFVWLDCELGLVFACPAPSACSSSLSSDSSSFAPAVAATAAPG